MELIKCDESYTDELSVLYQKIVSYLEEHINYPKWNRSYPSRNTVINAIRQGSLYACLKDGKAVGAVILNEDPGGDFDDGEWTKPARLGEYLVIHTLAVDPDITHCGIGTFIVNEALAMARSKAYKAVRLDVVPGNINAQRLYEGCGFRYAGTKDLKRGIKEIPVFDLYEHDLT